MAISLRGLWQAFMAHRHTAAEVGAATVNHSHTPESIGAAPANHTHPSMNRTVTDVLFSGEIIPSDRVWTNICPVNTNLYVALSVTGDSGEPDLSSSTGTWYVSTLVITPVALATGYSKEIHYLRIYGGYLQAYCPNQDHWDNSINAVFGIRPA